MANKRFVWKYNPTEDSPCHVCGKPYRKTARSQKHCPACQDKLQGTTGNARQSKIKRIRAQSKFQDFVPETKARKHSLTCDMTPNQIVLRRKRLNITQVDLAVEADVSLRAIQAAEQGWRRPSIRIEQTLEALEHEFKINKKEGG